MRFLRRMIPAILMIGLLTDSASAQERAEDQVLSRVGIEQNLNAALPLDAEFVNDQGQTIHLGDYYGDRPVVLALVYYNCPMLCGLVVNGMLKVLTEVAFEAGRDYEVVVVSFDETETPELARANKAVFVEKYGRPGAEEGIHFLVGKQPSIDRLTEAVGFNYEWVEDANEFAHGSGILLTTADGRVSRYFYGIDYASRNMRLGLVEASENKIGNPVDRLILFCYHYDPVTGKYGLLIHRVVNTAAVSTALLLGLLMFILFRKEK